MNVLHVTPYYAPAWAYGGVVRSVSGLAEAQAAAGNHVFVLTTDTLDRKHRLEAGHQRWNAVAVTRVANLSQWLRGRWNLSSPAGFRRAAANLINTHGIDIVHCHELRTVENWMAAPAARRLNVPLVVSPHGTLPYDIGRTLIKRIWDLWLSPRFVPYFDRVLALTPQEANQVEDLWTAMGIPLSTDQVRIVPNGIHLPDASPANRDAAFLQARGLSSGPTVLFVGRLTARKRPALLIRAFRELLPSMPEAQLLVAGPDEGEESRLRQQVHELELDRKVAITGLLTSDELDAAYRAADIFVLPAHGEGLSMAALEALAHGLPVILTEDCGLGAVVESGAGMMVEPDSAQLCTAMLVLLTDPARRASMASTAREAAAKTYAWPQVASRIEEIYHETVARNKQKIRS
jgi:glycosyltransferase involved in cell wall biosynthesis